MQIALSYIKENKKRILLCFLLIVVLLIIYSCIKDGDEEKIFSSENYVYTAESYEHDNYLTSSRPYINIMGDEINNINMDLISKYYEVITLDDKMMAYDYYESNEVLSLIVKIYYKEAPDSYPSETYIYNIDLNSKKLMSKHDLLRKYSVTTNDVSQIITEEIREYYNYEKRNGYINTECDFNCYLSNTHSLPILDDCNYYVKDGDLYAYKIIDLDSTFFYDINSGFYLFNFKIKDI